MSARRKPQYLKAAKWIAYNDEPTELDRDVVAQSISAALVADLFGIHECDVADDIIAFRNAYAFATEVRKSK